VKVESTKICHVVDQWFPTFFDLRATYSRFVGTRATFS
jgi:hypothetical protein